MSLFSVCIIDELFAVCSRERMHDFAILKSYVYRTGLGKYSSGLLAKAFNYKTISNGLYYEANKVGKL